MDHINQCIEIAAEENPNMWIHGEESIVEAGIKADPSDRKGLAEKKTLWRVKAEPRDRAEGVGSEHNGGALRSYGEDGGGRHHYGGADDGDRHHSGDGACEAIGEQNLSCLRFVMPQFLWRSFGSLPHLWHATLSYHPAPTCLRLIFMPNLATSVASILVTILSLAAIDCRRLGMASFAHQPKTRHTP